MDSYMASSYNDNRSCSNMEETTYQEGEIYYASSNKFVFKLSATYFSCNVHQNQFHIDEITIIFTMLDVMYTYIFFHPFIVYCIPFDNIIELVSFKLSLVMIIQRNAHIY